MPIRKLISTTKVPIKIWTQDIEDAALAQAITIANTMEIVAAFLRAIDALRRL